MKTVVLTGSTSGIGKELLTKLVEDKNLKIFAGYRNKDLVCDKYGNVEYFYIDMCDEQSIVQASEFIKSRVENIDILLNIAGGVIAGPIESIEVANLRKQFELNTFSHVKFTQSLMEKMKGTRIINISSMASFGQFPFISPYCASKRALDIFFNALAIENNNKLEIVSIKPGVISTPLWTKSIENNAQIISNCRGYEKEMNFMKVNALANTHRGLTVDYVADEIKKIMFSKKVKASYLLGWDAVMAQFLSYLPIKVVNFLIRKGLRWRVKASLK